jgi:hypothetical protein
MPISSKDGLNFLVNRDVRLVETIDGVGGAGNLAEVKESADMVILVERAENALDLARLHAEIRERSKKCEAARDGQIFVNNFAQCHCLWRASSTARTRRSDPNVRARIPVRRINVKQICLFHLSEGLAQFRGSVPCA